MPTELKIPRIQTEPLKVFVTTDDYEIRGLMHTKPGSYQARVSDMLNLKDLRFIPITQATYRSLNHPDEPPRKAWTLIVKLDTIKMVVPVDGPDREPAADAQQAPQDEAEESGAQAASG